MSAMPVRAWRRRLIRAPLHWLPESTVVRVPIGPMRGMKWMPASGPHGAWLGRLERSQLDAFIGAIRPGMTVWDIGANVGLYTIPAGRAVGERGHVFAFEPIARNVAYLRRHVELNGLQQVRVIEAAVADTTGAIAMAPGSSPSEARIQDGGLWTVPAVGLDEWRARTATPAPALVKIDVEGAEDRVLLGAVQTLHIAGPTLFISLHGAAQRRVCLAVLTSAGYEIASLQTGMSTERATEWRAERKHVA